MAAYQVVAVLVVVLAAVSAFPGFEGGFGGIGGGAHGQSEHHVDHHHHPQYKYSYAVKDTHTHDIKHHNEHRDGDKTEGEYSLVEPDGTTRTVKYHVHGKSGFIADVQRSGHAIHPQPVAHHVPAPQIHLSGHKHQGFGY